MATKICGGLCGKEKDESDFNKKDKEGVSDVYVQSVSI